MRSEHPQPGLCFQIKITITQKRIDCAIKRLVHTLFSPSAPGMGSFVNDTKFESSRSYVPHFNMSPQSWTGLNAFQKQFDRYKREDEWDSDKMPSTFLISCIQSISTSRAVKNLQSVFVWHSHSLCGNSLDSTHPLTYFLTDSGSMATVDLLFFNPFPLYSTQCGLCYN